MAWTYEQRWTPQPTPTDYIRYAAVEVEDANAQLDAAKKPRLSTGATQEIINKYRMAAGLDPYKNAYQLYLDSRGERTKDSKWSNFKANIASTFLSSAAGLTATGLKATDTLGVTDSAVQRFAHDLDLAQKTLAPQEDWAGTAGQLVGGTMFALMFGTGGAGASSTKIAGRLKAAAPIAGAFGVSGAGRTFIQAAAKPELPAWKVWTAAFGNAAVESATQLFGWAVARGLAGQIVRHTPGLSRVMGRQGIQGALAYLRKIASPLFKEAAEAGAIGFGMGASTQLGQDTLNKLLDITPELKWGELPSRALHAGAMGAAAPLLLGAAQAAMLYRGRARFQKRLSVLPDDELAYRIDLIETAREHGKPTPEWMLTDLQDEIGRRSTVRNTVENQTTAEATATPMEKPAPRSLRFPEYMVTGEKSNGPAGQTLSFAAAAEAEAAQARQAGRLLSFPEAARETMPQTRGGAVVPFTGEVSTKRVSPPIPEQTFPPVKPESIEPVDIARRLATNAAELPTTLTPIQRQTAIQQIRETEIGRVLNGLPKNVTPSQQAAQVQQATALVNQAEFLARSQLRQTQATPQETVAFPEAAKAPASSPEQPTNTLNFQKRVLEIGETAARAEELTRTQQPPILEEYATNESVLQKPEIKTTREVDAEVLYPPSGLTDTLRQFLADDEGAVNIDAIGRTALGGVAAAGGELGMVRSGLTAVLFDESRTLRFNSRLGPLAHAVIQQAGNVGRYIAGPWHKAWTDGLKSIPFIERGNLIRWMQKVRDDGQTNWATLVEHPERFAKGEIPTSAAKLVDIYSQAFDHTGTLAETLRLPQLQYGEVEGTFQLGPFKKASTNRYFRLYTRDGHQMLAARSGPLFEALIDWHLAHPDRNPHLPTVREDLLAVLTNDAQKAANVVVEGGVQKSGSLAYVRTWKEIPTTLMVKGRAVDIMIRNPLEHFRAAMEQQTRQISLWKSAMDDLLPRYGKLNEETGTYEFPLGDPKLGITDVSGLMSRLRADAIKEAGPHAGRLVENSFNRLVDNYHRTSSRGWREDYFVDFDATGTGKLVSTLDTTVTTNILMLSPLYDVVRFLTALPGTKGRGVAGYLSGLKDMLLHPRQFDAEYHALGAIEPMYADWTVHADSLFTDLARKNYRNAGMAIGRFTERRSQFLLARMHDRWITRLNELGKGIKPADADYMHYQLKLTRPEIKAIGEGRMTTALRSKVLQNAVNALAGLPEFAWNKGRVQNSPMGKFMFRFISVLGANVRASLNYTDAMRSNLRLAFNDSVGLAERRTAAKLVLSNGAKLLTFVAALGGNGIFQKYARRAVTGRPLVDAQDPETWYGKVTEALCEGGVFGPVYRLFEAAKYSDWNLYEVGTRIAWPLSVLADFGMALIGAGQYQNSPWVERLKALNLRYDPLYKAINGLYSKQTTPTRNDYYSARSMVRAWRKKQGEDTSYGTKEARNLRYYKLFEAIRDDDPDAVRQALADVKAWAKEQGWDAEQARRNLASSLSSRRPINLKPERRRAFLNHLSAKDRALVLAVERLYDVYYQRITRRPGVPVRPVRPVRPKRPTKGGDWYAAD